MSSIIEWESTVHIEINELAFTYLVDMLHSKATPTNLIFSPIEHHFKRKLKSYDYSVDNLFIFNNGDRVSRRSFERKTTLSTRNLLGFYKDEFYPISRTISNEHRLPAKDMDLNSINKTICRYIQYYKFAIVKNGKQLFNDDNDDGNNDEHDIEEFELTPNDFEYNDKIVTVRVSYNKITCVAGSKYTIEYEIEYPPDSLYGEILKYENILMYCVNKDQRYCRKGVIKLNNMFSCIMSKVQMWHCFNQEVPYQWAYKWNGIKGKLLITEDVDDKNTQQLAYLWPDANEIQTKPYTNFNLDILKNICVSVEIMDDCIVIIEVIGGLYNGDIFTTEPRTNINILKYMRNKIKRDKTTIDNKPLIVQQFYSGNMPNVYDETKFDGFIIVQNDLIIKWKIPTIDVKCVSEKSYSVAGQTFQLKHTGVVGKIYEMSYNFKILRERNDRIIGSSVQEYNVFIESVKLIHQQEMESMDCDTN